MPIEGKDRKPLHHAFPAWFYGPKGEAQQFGSEEDVPKGWKDHPSKHGTSGNVEAEKAMLDAGKSGMNTGTSTATGAGGNTSFAPGGEHEIDKDGHSWSTDLHAATKSKTNDGRWRMKVGVSRPAPVEGFPKPDEAREAVNQRGTPAEQPGGALDL